MRLTSVHPCGPCKLSNCNGFTFLAAIFMVMIIGIMLGLTGQSWKTIMKREREKELLFRGSQIKEAIENWYDPNYVVNGVKRSHPPVALTDLKYLLDNPTTLTHVRYLPHHYAAKLDDNNAACGSECPSIKLLQDPMTGKEWEIIKCDASVTGHPVCMKYPGTNTIIGVASKSEDKPLRTELSFKDTALENMGNLGLGSNKPLVKPLDSPFIAREEATKPAGDAEKKYKYSDWKFIHDPNNDHKKIFRAYHEGP